MADDAKKPDDAGRSRVPKPPSRHEIEEISRAQQYITDDWTGEGGRPPKPPEKHG